MPNHECSFLTDIMIIPNKHDNTLLLLIILSSRILLVNFDLRRIKDQTVRIYSTGRNRYRATVSELQLESMQDQSPLAHAISFNQYTRSTDKTCSTHLAQSPGVMRLMPSSICSLIAVRLYNVCFAMASHEIDLYRCK